jgi:hypothetical protein
MAAASLVMCALVAYFFSLAILSRALVFGIANLEILVMCAWVGYFFFSLFGYSLMCSSFWNCQFGDLGYVCLGGLPFFFSLFGSSLMCSSFWNRQLGDLGHVYLGGLLFFFPLWLFSHVL